MRLLLVLFRMLLLTGKVDGGAGDRLTPFKVTVIGRVDFVGSVSAAEDVERMRRSPRRRHVVVRFFEPVARRHFDGTIVFQLTRFPLTF